MSEAATGIKKLVGVEVSDQALTGICLNSEREAVDFHQVLLDSGADITAQIINFVGELKSRFGDFDKAGVAISGLVDRRTNRVALSTQISDYANVDLAKQVEAATGSRILLENDANAAAYGEYVLGAGRGSLNIFYVLLGLGIGGAFIFDGKLWRGASGFAGEFGHIVVDSEDNLSLEDVASSANILRRVKTRFRQDQTSSLGKIPEEDFTITAVVNEAANGDDFTRMMLERTGTSVGKAMATVINLLNIEKIVVGGEVMRVADVMVDAISASAAKFSFRPSFETTNIVAGELGDKATAIGVALLSEEI